MEKRTVVITGGNSGLGYQCAKNIATNSKNYTIILACRNPNKAGDAVESLKRETGNPNIYALELDLASLESIRNFYTSYKNKNYPPLYSIVCNAGLNRRPLEYTKDGFEVTFGVCHLGHFLLTNLMLGMMIDNGRIVFVSSDMHEPPKLVCPSTPIFTSTRKLAYPEIDGKASRSTLSLRYPMAKLCNILCVHEMVDRLAAETNSHITVNAFNPGLMTDTNFMPLNTNKVVRSIVAGCTTAFARAIGVLGSGVESGKALAALVTEQKFENSTRNYYDRSNETPVKSSIPSYDKEASSCGLKVLTWFI